MKWTKRQLEYLTKARNDARNSVDEMLSRLVSERADGPRRLAERLSGSASPLMRDDLLFSTYQQLLDMHENPDATEADRETVLEYYTDEHFRWRVPQSTSGGANMMENARHDMLRDVIEKLRTFGFAYFTEEPAEPEE